VLLMVITLATIRLRHMSPTCSRCWDLTIDTQLRPLYVCLS